MIGCRFNIELRTQVETRILNPLMNTLLVIKWYRFWPVYIFLTANFQAVVQHRNLSLKILTNRDERMPESVTLPF